MRAESSTNAITIIIPAYNNWDALSQCLASLKQHVSHRERIFIIDDASSEKGYERNIREAIANRPNAYYVRNAENLGFVKTCNRAVIELDTSGNDVLLLNSDTVVTAGFLEEMRACLYAGGRHGVCCPRSNDATICSFPRALAGETPGESFTCWQNLKDALPRYTVVPTGVGFCMLIRRSLIDRFGLFDEAFSPGFNEENDFCCRISRYGYSTVLANRAYVFHLQQKSFTDSERRRLDRAHRALLDRRYPEYTRAVNDYEHWEIPAVEHFAERLGRRASRRSVVIDLSHMGAAYNGTTEYTINLLTHLVPLLSIQYDVTILVNEAFDHLFRLSAIYPEAAFVDAIREQRFDLAFVPQQIFSMRHLAQLNRLALRWVITMHDIIAFRCTYLKSQDMQTALRAVMRYSSDIVTVSEASLRDLRQYTGELLSPRSDCHFAVIHHGYTEPSATSDHSFLPLPKGFLLVIGNHYEHKALQRTMENLPDMPTVVVGGSAERFPMREETVVLQSGGITSSRMRALYEHCGIVIFPSQYEGFGFPLLHGSRFGKPVIAFDTESTREIGNAFGVGQYLHLCQTFEALPGMVGRALFKHTLAPMQHARTWMDAARDTAAAIAAAFDTSVEYRILEDRFAAIRTLERVQTPTCGCHSRPLRRMSRALRRLGRRILRR